MIYLEETGFEDDTTHGGRVLKMEEFLHLPFGAAWAIIGLPGWKCYSVASDTREKLLTNQTQQV